MPYRLINLGHSLTFVSAIATDLVMEHHDDSRDDATLVELALAGEREAFGVLLLRFYPSVMRLCQRLLGPTPEAEDIAQEAALQAFLGLVHLQESTRFGAWLHAIAANLARMALRRRRPISLHTLPEETPVTLLWTDPIPTPADAYAAREIHDSIVAALNELAVVQRDVVIGFYLAGYSYAELAELLGVPVSTIKWRLFDGRRQLRRVLQPLVGEWLPSDRQRRKERAVDATDLVEVKVEFVGRGVTSRDPERLVMLRAPSTGYKLPIHMRAAEGDAIGGVLEGQQPPRPVTHDLILRVLATVGGQVQRVIIQRLVDGMFYAEMTLAHSGQQHAIEARLSDALALAVRANVPIYITREVFDATSFDPHNRQQERERAIQATQRYRAEHPQPAPPLPVAALGPLAPTVLQQIDDSLRHLLDDTGGRIALLIHRSGTPVAWKGPVVAEYLVPYATALRQQDQDQQHELAMKLFGIAEQDADDADLLIRFGRVGQDWDLQMVIASDLVADKEAQMNQHFLHTVKELQAILPDVSSMD